MITNAYGTKAFLFTERFIAMCESNSEKYLAPSFSNKV
jgi:hypothetical protein